MFDPDQLELELHAPALRWAAARLAYEVFPQWAGRILEMTSAHLHTERIPHLFSRDLKELDPSLNDDLLDLFGRCQRSLSNQFTFLAHGEKLPEEIDWEIHQGTAWSGEMHSFDYGLDLALNYRVSGDPRDARHLRYLIAHWIASNPPGQGDGWWLGPLARRLRNWVLAADLARKDWENDAAFFALVNRSIALQTQFLVSHADSPCSSEVRLNSARALALAGKFFGDRRGAQVRACAGRILSGEIEWQFDGSGHLTQWRAGTLLKLAQAMVESLAFQTCGGIGEIAIKDKLRQILTALAGILLPDGSLPVFGKSPAPSGEELTEVFALAAVILNEPVWKAFAENFGILPYMMLGEAGWARFKEFPQTAWSPDTRLFPQSGLYRLSGGDSSAMIINGHLPISSDDHQDGFSYELGLLGQRVVVDSGVQFPDEQSEDQYFSTARAHNVLLVDGDGPQCAASEAPPSPAEIWETENGVMGIRLAHGGYSRLGITHQRAWYRLEGGGWAVIDRLEGRGRHRVSSLIHFYPTFALEIGESATVARSRSMTVSVIPLGQPGWQIAASRGGVSRFQSWYSPTMGMKYATGVLRLEWDIVSWPWIGGYLILPGSGHGFEAGQSDPAANQARFYLDGKERLLLFGGSSGAWRKLG